MRKIHYLKTWPEYFRAVKRGDKTFEIRKNDRPEGPYEAGDALVLQEYNPETGYTGTDDLWLDVPYILDKQPFLPEGYVCMSAKKRKTARPKLTPLRYVIALFLTLLSVWLVFTAQNNARQVNILTSQLNDSRTSFERLAEANSEITSNMNKKELEHQEAVEELMGEISILQQEQQELREQLDRKMNLPLHEEEGKSSRGGDRFAKRKMRVTAYDKEYDSCGKLPSHPEYGITASGEYVREWYTVAAGPELKFGTIVYIPFFVDQPNKGIFVVKDRGSAIKRDCIDVYLEDNKACWEFGVKYLEVYILEV